MACRVVIIVALALLCAEAGNAEVRTSGPFPLERYADRGAVGVFVPGTDETVRPDSIVIDLVSRIPWSAITPVPGNPLALDIRIGKRGPPFVYLALPDFVEKNDRRYPIAVVGGGFHGVLTSDSTRLKGLVTLDDVIEGRLEWRPDDDAVATVERLDRRIERNDDLRLPATILLVAAVIGAALVRPRLAPRVLLVALALNLWLSPALALAAGLAAVALPLGPACAAVIAIYLAALGLDAETVALSPLGPSQLGRFYGIDNLTETLLLLPALLGAALLGRRRGVVVAALALVTIAGNRFGADGGGLLVLLAGYGVMALRLSGHRLTLRLGLVLAGATVLAGLALVGLDAATGGSSHVTNALGDGPGALVRDFGDRISRSVERTFDSPGPAIVVLCSLGVLAWAARHRGDAVLDALLVALAVSLVVNDTPSDVLAAGGAAAVVLARLRPASGRLV